MKQGKIFIKFSHFMETRLLRLGAERPMSAEIIPTRKTGIALKYFEAYWKHSDKIWSN